MPDPTDTDDLRRMHAARIGPQVTCPASRHAAMIAHTMIHGGNDHEGGSIASAVASLWEVRAREAEMRAENERLRDVLRSVVSRCQNAKSECLDGAPVSAYNLASCILGQIGADVAALSSQPDSGEGADHA